MLAVPVWSLDWSCNHSETALPQPVHYMQCVMYHTHYACDVVYPHVFLSESGHEDNEDEVEEGNPAMSAGN